VKGEWVYIYRAMDKAGKTVDFYLSRKGARTVKKLVEYDAPVQCACSA
jgi:transposase-like protein